MHIVIKWIKLKTNKREEPCSVKWNEGVTNNNGKEKA